MRVDTDSDKDESIVATTHSEGSESASESEQKRPSLFAGL